VLAALEPFQVMRGPEGLETGTQAPAFTLTNTEGQKISLTDLMTQRILLSFSSTHCPACAEMYPHLEALSEGRQEISVVMVSRGTTEENRRLVEEQDFAVIGTLAVMMIVSLLLAVGAFALPQPVVATECPYCLHSHICDYCWCGDDTWCAGECWKVKCWDDNCSYMGFYWDCRP